MAKARYGSQTGTKIFIAVSIGLLVFAIAFVVGSISKAGRFNDFKNEVASYSGDVKSKISLEYNGTTRELTKKDFSRMFMVMVSSRVRKDHVVGASILDSMTVRLTKILDESAEMTISKTDKGFVNVTYQSEKSSYTYWFQYSYDNIQIYAGLKEGA